MKKIAFDYNMSAADFDRLVNRELLCVHRNAVSAWRCMKNARVSLIGIVNASYGLDDDSVFVAQRSIEARKFTPLMLEKAEKSGKALTAIICEYPGSKEKYVFQTCFDKEK